MTKPLTLDFLDQHKLFAISQYWPLGLIFLNLSFGVKYQTGGGLVIYHDF